MIKLQRFQYLFLPLYMLLLGGLMRQATLYPDGYYYWDWSQHLQLSYYDGSPLIAWVLRLYTHLLGSHLFSIYLLGLSVAVITAWAIYRTATLLFNSAAGRFAIFLWLLCPGVIRYFFFQVSYNTMLALTWSLTVLAMVKLQQTRQTRYFYLCGFLAGSVLLAKYTGILLLFAYLCVCSVYPDYRFVWKNRHFYLALLLALLVFSPVIIWNMQHDWLSFRFQLSHGYHGAQEGMLTQLRYYFQWLILDFNLALVALMLLAWRAGRQLWQAPLALLTLPALTVLLFFGISACFARPESNWYAPFYITSVVLIAGLWQKQKISGVWKWLVLLPMAGISFLLILGNTWPAYYIGHGPGWSQVPAMRRLMGHVNPQWYKNTWVVAPDYQMLSFAQHFLPGHPHIAARSLEAGHQYYLWQAVPRDATFVLLSLRPEANPRCQLLSQQSVTQYRVWQAPWQWTLYVYRCYSQQ